MDTKFKCCLQVTMFHERLANDKAIVKGLFLLLIVPITQFKELLTRQKNSIFDKIFNQ